MNPHDQRRPPDVAPRDPGGYGDLEEGRRYRYSDERERVGADGLPEYTDDESMRPRFNSGADADFERAGHERRSFRGHGPREPQRLDAQIREDLSEQLTWHDGIDATRLSVSVADGEVTLDGTVPDRRTKRLAEGVAYSVRGVREVHNRLRLPENAG